MMQELTLAWRKISGLQEMILILSSSLTYESSIEVDADTQKYTLVRGSPQKIQLEVFGVKWLFSE